MVASPGAGGPVRIPRRIGRQQMLSWKMMNRELGAEAALDWDLVDELIDG